MTDDRFPPKQPPEGGGNETSANDREPEGRPEAAEVRAVDEVPLPADAPYRWASERRSESGNASAEASEARMGAAGSARNDSAEARPPPAEESVWVELDDSAEAPVRPGAMELDLGGPNEPPLSEDPALALRKVTSALRRRAWTVHGGSIGLTWLAFALLLTLATGWALGAGAPQWLRPLALLALVASGAAAAWLAYKRAGAPSDIALARLLESRDPRAAGLATAVELSTRSAHAHGYSEELARAHVETTAAHVAETGPARAFDHKPLKLSGAAAGASLTALLAALALTESALPGLAQLARGLPGEKGDTERHLAPITGDISLTYLYPAHTGLPSKTIEGTNGEITAPAGTQVRLETRADRDLAKAFLDIDGGGSLPLEVKGRQLSGTLLVQRSGSYSFRFEGATGSEIARGPAIPITVTEDGVPTVDITSPVAELTVTEKDGVPLRFEAADDYGVAKVELVYKIGDADEQIVPLASWAEPKRRADGGHTWELSMLSVHPGDVITYYLRATDNDAVGGAKQGQSRTQSLKIFSEAEHRRELVAKVEEAWEAMVLALGDRIAPRQGPRKVSGAQRIDAGAPADEQVLQVGSTLADVTNELRKDERAPQELVAALINISQGLLEKAQRVRTTRAAARSAPAVRLAELDRAEGAEQAELEKSVLYLEALLDRQRILQIQELAEEMASSRRELANLMEEYRKAPTDAAKSEIQRELSRLKQRMNELMQRMAELSKGLQDEHLNAEAMQQLAKERDLMGGLDEIEKLLGEGKVDEAMAKLQELGMQMDEMAQALSEAADKQAENDPALKELQQNLQAYEDQLKELQQDQQQLTEATEKLKREQAKALEEQLAQGGQKLVEELKAKVAEAKTALDRIPAAEIPPRLTEDLGGAQERLQDLERALSVKDFDAAQESAAQALAYAEGLDQELDRESVYSKRFGMPDAGQIDEAKEHADRATPLVREVKQKLDELFSDPGGRMSTEQRARMQQMAQRQQQLAQRMNQLQQQAEKIGEQAPIFDESAKQQMQGAKGSMGEASQRLAGRETGGALSAERRAQEQLQSLQQGLEKAKQQARGNKGGGGFPMPLASGGMGRGESGGQGEFDEKEKVAIPSADQYKAPEEFRKDILDAMKQDAPAPFKEHVREYYEEIVK